MQTNFDLWITHKQFATSIPLNILSSSYVFDHLGDMALLQFSL